MWDGTRRYVCSTIIERDDDGEIHARTKIHGGFVKLPREAMPGNNEITQNSRISYSYAHGVVEGVAKMFGLLARGSGEKVILTHEEIDMDRQSIKSDMDALFTQLTLMDKNSYVDSLNESMNPAKMVLARSLEHAFYGSPGFDKETPPWKEEPLPYDI